MIHEIIQVGPLQCNCSIIGDDATREAMVIDPGDDIKNVLAIIRKHNLLRDLGLEPGLPASAQINLMINSSRKGNDGKPISDPPGGSMVHEGADPTYPH